MLADLPSHVDLTPASPSLRRRARMHGDCCRFVLNERGERRTINHCFADHRRYLKVPAAVSAAAVLASASALQSIDSDRWRNGPYDVRHKFICEFKSKKICRIHGRRLSVSLEDLCFQINDETSSEMIEWE